jgi:Domain of Unknown Function (DUF1080)
MNFTQTFTKSSSRAALMLCAAVGLAAAQTDMINRLRPYEVIQGFELMFDGATANSFRDRFVNYAQNNTTSTTLNSSWSLNTTLTDPDQSGATFGAITITNPNITDIRTKKLYRDFDWRFEFRNNGNQGVFYRFDVSGQYAWHTGIEYAIDNNVTQSTQKFRAGAAYDLFAPSTQEYFLNNTSKWNSLRIVAKGDSVEHWLNGVKVAGFKYWSASFLTAYQNSKWTGFNRYCQTAPNNRTYIPEGYLGLQGDHGGTWQIRRMRILHDSASSIDRVKFGPIDTTTTAINPFDTKGQGAKGSFRLESGAGRLHVELNGESLRAVELRDLEGRLAHREIVAGARSAHNVNVSTLSQGLYFVRIEGQAGLVRHARAVIH